MRRFLIGGLSLALVLGGAGIASAAQTQTIDGNIFPKKLFPKKRTGVALRVVTQTADTTGAQPSPANRALIDFDKKLAFNFRGLARCPLNLIQGQPFSVARNRCSRAIVGRGNATAELGAGNEIPVTVTAFNGRPQGGRPTVYLHSDPGFDPQVLIGVVYRFGAPGRAFNARLRVTIPPLGGGAASLTRFAVTIKKRWRFRGKVQNFISAKCPKPRVVRYRGIFRFNSGQTLRAFDKHRCFRRWR